MQLKNLGHVTLVTEAWLQSRLKCRVRMATVAPIAVAFISVAAATWAPGWPVYIGIAVALIVVGFFALAMHGYVEAYELDRLIKDTQALPGTQALPLLARIEAGLLGNGYRLPRTHFVDIAANVYGRRTQLGLDDNDESRAIRRARAFLAVPVEGSDVQADEKVTALLNRLRAGKSSSDNA